MNQQWRPIEDAPVEGQWALVSADGAMNCMYVKRGQLPEDWTHATHPNVIPSWVTHWMPLPEPPQETNMQDNQANRDKQVQSICAEPIDQNLTDVINRGPGGLKWDESRSTFEDYVELVQIWAAKRGIIENSTAAAQLEKLDEERQETIEAIYQYMFREELSNDPAKAWDEVVDGFGDQLVCLVNAAAIAGVDLTDALAHAYETIKDRRGYLASNGIFIKDEASHE